MQPTTQRVKEWRTVLLEKQKKMWSQVFVYLGMKREPVPKMLHTVIFVWGAANWAVNREKRMMSMRQPRPEMFSPGWEARREYLINSHQAWWDLPSDVGRPRRPSRHAEHSRPEQWSMNPTAEQAAGCKQRRWSAETMTWSSVIPPLECHDVCWNVACASLDYMTHPINRKLTSSFLSTDICVGRQI